MQNFILLYCFSYAEYPIAIYIFYYLQANQCTIETVIHKNYMEMYEFVDTYLYLRLSHQLIFRRVRVFTILKCIITVFHMVRGKDSRKKLLLRKF